MHKNPFVRAKAKRTNYVRGQPNKTELEYQRMLEARVLTGEVASFAFESVTLVLAPGLRYTPDFMVVLSDGTVEFHEVKGTFIRDDANAKMKMAASVFWMFGWVLAVRAKKQWTIKTLDEAFLSD